MDWNFMPGDQLAPGRHVTSRLGGGERYEAYLAWNDELLCPTVVKVIRPHLVNDARARGAVAAEASALQHLEHPSFIRAFAADVDGPRPFVELEFLDGPRLSTLLRRHGILVPEQLFPLARQMAAALDYLHRRGFVHLDVKPSNIIMGPVPRLIDLSIARRIEDLAHVRSPVGTDAYMAPEQCDPGLFHLLAPATDVWGLGVTLYQASTKQLPFARGEGGPDGPARWPQLTAEPASPPAKMPRPIASLVMRCLASDPTQRPTPRELFDAFDALAAEHGISRVRFR